MVEEIRRRRSTRETLVVRDPGHRRCDLRQAGPRRELCYFHYICTVGRDLPRVSDVESVTPGGESNSSGVGQTRFIRFHNPYLADERQLILSIAAGDVYKRKDQRC